MVFLILLWKKRCQSLELEYYDTDNEQIKLWFCIVFISYVAKIFALIMEIIS